MSAIHLISAVLFLLSAGLLVVAERLKDEYESLSRKAAIASLAAVFGAGVLFVMDVPQIGGLMNPWAKTAKPKKKGGASDDDDGEMAERGGAGGRDGKSKMAAAGGDDKDGGKSSSGSGADKGDEDDSDTPPDCEGCPNFIDIAPGSSQIGADATEPAASKAEKPGKTVTIWPGFAISQRPVSKTQYKRFVEATGRKLMQCPQPEGAPLLGKPADPKITPATCISYDDASAYASWLSARTGKVYRLPTAAQWEFVARGAVDPDAAKTEEPLVKSDGKGAVGGWPVAGMKMGVAEMVVDCWSDKLEVIEDGATGRNRANCQTRVLKGAARGEEPRWQQPWARRPIPVAAHSLDVGFRVVRMN